MGFKLVKAGLCIGSRVRVEIFDPVPAGRRLNCNISSILPFLRMVSPPLISIDIVLYTLNSFEILKTEICDR